MCVLRALQGQDDRRAGKLLMARLLAGRGWQTLVVLAGDPGKMTTETQLHHRAALTFWGQPRAIRWDAVTQAPRGPQLSDLQIPWSNQRSLSMPWRARRAKAAGLLPCGTVLRVGTALVTLGGDPTQWALLSSHC